MSFGGSAALANVGARKTGAFQDWKEDDEITEIFLPLPPNTNKKELACVIAADKLHIRHTRVQKTLLRAEPLAGPVIPEDSTWYIQGDMLMIVLGKVRGRVPLQCGSAMRIVPHSSYTLLQQWRGETKSDQYWGASLAAKGGAYECHMTVEEVSAARAARERKEKESEEERRTRVKASQKALREQVAATCRCVPHRPIKGSSMHLVLPFLSLPARAARPPGLPTTHAHCLWQEQRELEEEERETRRREALQRSRERAREERAAREHLDYAEPGERLGRRRDTERRDTGTRTYFSRERLPFWIALMAGFVLTIPRLYTIWSLFNGPSDKPDESWSDRKVQDDDWS